MKKIYIAGFDVFKEDAKEIGEKYVSLCAKYGFEGVYPLDNEFDFTQDKQKVALDIFKANKQLIEDSDIIIANLNPFRGKEPDSGTIWECGYGFGKGKQVYGYMQGGSSYLDTFSEEEKVFKDGLYWDKNNLFIEDFDYPINLMISCSVDGLFFGEFEFVLKKISSI